jgi:hypothetical protein
MLFVINLIFGRMLALWFSLVVGMHPIHVSLTEVNYNTRARAVQITVRIFTDDLEMSIRKQTQQPELDILQPPTGTTTDQLVSGYLMQKFAVKVDGKLRKTTYLGHEVEGQMVVCYVEIEDVKKPYKKVEVKNTVVMETHADQNNLVNVNLGDRIKSLRLTAEAPEGAVQF